MSRSTHRFPGDALPRRLPVPRALALARLGGGLLLCLLAGPAARAATSDDDPIERTLSNGQVLVSYKGRAYEKYALSELRNKNLAGKQVCVTGKFNLLNAEKQRFSLLGGEELFYLKQPILAARLRRLDNVYVFGLALEQKDRPGCVVEVAAIHQRQNDFQLFDEMFETFAQARAWRPLVELGQSMLRQGEEYRGYGGEAATVEEYTRCARRAFIRAVNLRIELADPNDAAELFETALMIDEFLPGPAYDALRIDLLLKVLRINPRHERARRILVERYQIYFIPETGQVMDEADYQAWLASKRGQPTATATATVTPPIPSVVAQDPAAFLIPRIPRARRLWELRQAVRDGSAVGLVRLKHEVLYGPDDDLALLAVHHLAGAAERSGEALAALLDLRANERLADGARREAIVDVLAWRGDELGRNLLVEIIRADRSERLRGYAVNAVAWLGDSDALGRLVALSEEEAAAPLRERLDERLRGLTGQTRTPPGGWSIWWSAHQNDPRFRTPRRP